MNCLEADQPQHKDKEWYIIMYAGVNGSTFIWRGCAHITPSRVIVTTARLNDGHKTHTHTEKKGLLTLERKKHYNDVSIIIAQSG